jgi:putative addiction module killer protein
LTVINAVQELLLEDGSSPYADWFNGLPPDVAAKVVTAKLRMQQGNLSSVEWFRGIGEYKIDYGPGWRIYLAKDGQTDHLAGRGIQGQAAARHRPGCGSVGSVQGRQGACCEEGKGWPRQATKEGMKRWH